MKNDRMFNKTILKFFDDLRGIPQSFEDVSEYVSNRVHKPCDAECEVALSFLEAAEYIQRCEATAADERMWRITAAGIRMAQRQVPVGELDPMIWG